MFSKNEEEHTSGSTPSETVIGPTVRVEGIFNSEDSMAIEGEVVGKIETTKDIRVGKTANIEADMNAANMTIAGTVRGSMNVAGKLTLLSTARVFGDVTTNVLSVESGAVLQGQCTTESASSAPETEMTASPSASE